MSSADSYANLREWELDAMLENECNCDLCQCFGEGECKRHEENCDHCNSGKSHEDCDWLAEI